MDKRQRRSPVVELLVALASVAGTAMIVWYNMAPQERMWLKLEMARGAHQLSDRLARRTGRKGMGDELAGRDFGRYRIAYRLSLVRDEIAKWRA